MVSPRSGRADTAGAFSDQSEGAHSSTMGQLRRMFLVSCPGNN